MSTDDIDRDGQSEDIEVSLIPSSTFNELAQEGPSMNYSDYGSDATGGTNHGITSMANNVAMRRGADNNVDRNSINQLRNGGTAFYNNMLNSSNPGGYLPFPHFDSMYYYLDAVNARLSNTIDQQILSSTHSGTGGLVGPLGLQQHQNLESMGLSSSAHDPDHMNPEGCAGAKLLRRRGTSAVTINNSNPNNQDKGGQQYDPLTNYLVQQMMLTSTQQNLGLAPPSLLPMTTLPFTSASNPSEMFLRSQLMQPNGNLNPYLSSTGSAWNMMGRNIPTFPPSTMFPSSVSHLQQQQQLGSEEDAIATRIAILQQEQMRIQSQQSAISNILNEHERNSSISSHLQQQMMANQYRYFASMNSDQNLSQSQIEASNFSHGSIHHKSPTLSKPKRKRRKKKGQHHLELDGNLLKSKKRSEEEDEKIRQRPFQCLGVGDDNRRLSLFLCFLRKECIEVFKAEAEDVHERRQSKKVFLGQVGLRCRFCAHLEPTKRLGRASSFPSSLDRIYQSVTMMIRDHFSHCPEMLPEVREKYESYRAIKKKKNIEVMESKSYWVHSAKELGLIDRDLGNLGGSWIEMSKESQCALSDNADKSDQGVLKLRMDSLSGDEGNEKTISEVDGSTIDKLDRIEISKTDKMTVSTVDESDFDVNDKTISMHEESTPHSEICKTDKMTSSMVDESEINQQS